MSSVDKSPYLLFAGNTETPLHFFNSLKRLLENHRALQDGQFTIACSTKKIEGLQWFILRIYGYRPSPFFFSSENLTQYLSSQPEISKEDELFFLAQEKILSILTGSGFGQVDFLFDRGRNNKLIFVCKTTISIRKIFCIAD